MRHLRIAYETDAPGSAFPVPALNALPLERLADVEIRAIPSAACAEECASELFARLPALATADIALDNDGLLICGTTPAPAQHEIRRSVGGFFSRAPLCPAVRGVSQLRVSANVLWAWLPQAPEFPELRSLAVVWSRTSHIEPEEKALGLRSPRLETVQHWGAAVAATPVQRTRFELLMRLLAPDRNPEVSFHGVVLVAP